MQGVEYLPPERKDVSVSDAGVNEGDPLGLSTSSGDPGATNDEPGTATTDQLERLAALENLSTLALQVASSLDLQETLTQVARAVTEGLGYGAAVLNLVDGDDLEVVVAEGPDDVRETLLHSRQSRAQWDEVLDWSQPLGTLRFIDGRHDPAPDGMLEWVPDIDISPDPGDWHPQDSLFAPLRSPRGDLVGVLSVDIPASGRRPTPAQLELLERFAAQAALAIDRAQTHERLAMGEELFRRVFDGSPSALAVLTDQGRVVDVNPRCAELAEAPRERLIGTLVTDYPWLPDARWVREALDNARAGADAVREFELRDGRVVSATVTPLVTRGGSRALVRLEDVSDRRRAEASLRLAARTDPLTGLPNRAALDSYLSRPMDTAGVAALYCDLDHFKRVNDEHGHGTGDLMLRIVGQRLAATARSADLVARIGGDEFVVVIAARNSDDAIAVADRLAVAIQQPVTDETVALTPSLSIGIAMGGEGLRRADLLLRSDRALYAAKAAGRHCWHLYDDGLGPLPAG